MSIGTFLNGGTAAQLRGLAWLALSDSGQVGAGSVSDDGGGGGTVVWSYGGVVPCRIDPLAAAGAGAAADRIDERSTHLLALPSGYAATAQNRVAIAGRGTFVVTAARQRTAADVNYFEVIRLD